MISVEAAQNMILNAFSCGPAGPVLLSKSPGLILADAPIAAIDSPSFDNSAMDGYALIHADTDAAESEKPVRLRVTGATYAGDATDRPVGSGEAIYITTGAMMPPAATAVVKQEDVEERDGVITVRRPVRKDENVRRRGEEIRRGATALVAGTRLNAAGVGYLTGLGVTSVNVYLPPKVAIVPTGSELLRAGEKMSDGKIYDSNSVALSCALREMGVDPYVWPPIPDEPAEQESAIALALERTDILIVTGGVSVGKADHIKDLLERLDVKPLFWKVRQKPGKPLYFGTKGTRLIFGLPGNPVSALVCYYEYVRPAIRKWMGLANPFLPTGKARLRESMRKEAGKAHFLRAITVREGEKWMTSPSGAQGSHMMRPFAEANSLIYAREGIAELKIGDEVEIHWLPPFDLRHFLDGQSDNPPITAGLANQ